MTPMTMSGYLAETHRQDLLREAERARLASEIPHESDGIWTAALMLVADLLLDAGQRLHKHLAHKRLEHAYGATGSMGVVCCGDDGLCGHIVSLDV
ncbi:MAG TPA: hypothetical protein VF510_05510 [Ktedonobacterales bacterium]